MGARVDGILSRIRRPEYTGENRCTPCTVVNVGIAVLLSGALGLGRPALAPVALGISLAVIYLRGYLVPGTPWLTKRYLPDRVLRRFEEAHGRGDATLVGATGGAEMDPEPVLREVGALEFTPDGSDLRLTDEFRTRWGERVEAVRGSEYGPRLATLLSTDEVVAPDSLEVRADDATATVLRDGAPVATWPSEAALVGDLAAAPVLRERLPRWGELDLVARGRLLHAVRLFLERCPSCDGALAFSEGAVESCCRTAEVVTLACEACDALVLEVEV